MGFSLLTKNALQNVVQFFRPWGRDFLVLRSINKRIKAAYHDHLNNILNIDKFMARNSEAACRDAEEAIDRLIRGFGDKDFARLPPQNVYLDEDAQKVLWDLIMKPYERARN